MESLNFTEMFERPQIFTIHEQYSGSIVNDLSSSTQDIFDVSTIIIHNLEPAVSKEILDPFDIPLLFSGKIYSRNLCSSDKHNNKKIRFSDSFLVDDDQNIDDSFSKHLDDPSENIDVLPKEPTIDNYLNINTMTNKNITENVSTNIDISNNYNLRSHRRGESFLPVTEARSGITTSPVVSNVVKYDSDQMGKLKDLIGVMENFYLETEDSEARAFSTRRTDITNDDSTFWHSCHLCHEEFSTRKGLANHIKRHPKIMVGKNSCVYCKCSFIDSLELADHLTSSHAFDISNFTCESCQADCIGADMFDRHQYFCHQSGTGQCCLCAKCDKVYYDTEIFAYHQQQIKHCKICNIRFCMSTSQFKEHKEKHILHMYKCSFCNASYVTKAALTKHIESHNNLSDMTHDIESEDLDNLNSNDGPNISDNFEDIENDEEKFKKVRKKRHACPLCSIKFFHMKNLWRHVVNTHSEYIKDENNELIKAVEGKKCGICLRSFAKKASLLAHLSAHIKEKYSECIEGGKCGVCHKTFRHQRYLVDHMRLHTGRGTQQCPHCDKQFLRRSQLTAHLEMHDNARRVHPCTQCDKTYIRKRDLQLHVRVKHNPDNPPNEVKTESAPNEGYPCPTCGKCTPSPLKLRLHQLSHGSRAPYKCEECSREFPTLHNLKRHCLVHWNIKQYTCTTCNTTFRHGQSLKRHMVTHTGERPHVCNHCGKGFALQGTLKTHMQLHATDRNFPCRKCGESFTNRRDLKSHSCGSVGNSSAGSNISTSSNSSSNSNPSTEQLESDNLNAIFVAYNPEQDGLLQNNQDSDVALVIHQMAGPDATSSGQSVVPITSLSNTQHHHHHNVQTSVGNMIFSRGVTDGGPVHLVKQESNHGTAREPLPSMDNIMGGLGRETNGGHLQMIKTDPDSDSLQLVKNDPNLNLGQENLSVHGSIAVSQDSDLLSQAFTIMRDDAVSNNVDFTISSNEGVGQLHNSAGGSTVYTLVAVQPDPNNPHHLVTVPTTAHLNNAHIHHSNHAPHHISTIHSSSHVQSSLAVPTTTTAHMTTSSRVAHPSLQVSTTSGSVLSTTSGSVLSNVNHIPSNAADVPIGGGQHLPLIRHMPIEYHTTATSPHIPIARSIARPSHIPTTSRLTTSGQIPKNVVHEANIQSIQHISHIQTSEQIPPISEILSSSMATHTHSTNTHSTNTHSTNTHNTNSHNTNSHNTYNTNTHSTNTHNTLVTDVPTKMTHADVNTDIHTNQTNTNTTSEYTNRTDTHRINNHHYIQN